jgi:prefoldin alpha subunit
MSKKTTKTVEKREPTEKEMQERHMQAHMLEQQLRQLQKYLENFEEQISNIRALIDAIKEFSELKKGEPVLAPLTNGVFIKAKLEDSSELLINVGNGVVVAKTIPEAIKLLEGQESEVQNYRKEVLAQLEELMKQIEQLQE